MKGLIFKEIYLSRKRIIISLSIYFFLMLICVLVKLSAVYGNLRLLSEDAVRNAVTVTFYLAVFCSVLSFAGFIADNINSDIVSHWSNFQRSTPMTEKQVVGAAYISTGIMLLSMLVLHIFMTLMLCAVFGETFRSYFIPAFFAFAFIVFIGYAYRLFCFYRFRQQKKAQFVYSVAFFCLYLSLCLAAYSRMYVYKDKANAHNAQLAEKMGLPSDTFDTMDIGPFVKQDLIAVRDLFKSYWWIIVLLFITLTVVLYFVSVKALKRPFDLAGQITQDKKEKKSIFSSLSESKKAAKGDDS